MCELRRSEHYDLFDHLVLELRLLRVIDPLRKRYFRPCLYELLQGTYHESSVMLVVSAFYWFITETVLWSNCEAIHHSMRLLFVLWNLRMDSLLWDGQHTSSRRVHVIGFGISLMFTGIVIPRYSAHRARFGGTTTRKKNRRVHSRCIERFSGRANSQVFFFVQKSKYLRST